MIGKKLPPNRRRGGSGFPATGSLLGAVRGEPRMSPIPKERAHVENVPREPACLEILVELKTEHSYHRFMKERVAEIVAAYLAHNRIDASEIPGLIATVNRSLMSLGRPQAAPAENRTPAVPVRRSISATEII